MVIAQTRSKRKATGGRYVANRKKRLYEDGSKPTLTRVGETKSKVIKMKGGSKKIRLLTVDVANLADPKTKKFAKAKIESVLESSANRHFVRRNIITKGSIIQTDKGKAKVTSRPSQDGIVNAVLIKE